jgi:hypothetical protein
MFNVRELMANLQAAQAAAPQLLFRPCYGWTGGGCWICTGTCYDTCFASCGYLSGGCGGVTTVTVFQAAFAADPEAQRQQLGALKEQLRQAVADIEKQEQSLEKNK